MVTKCNAGTIQAVKGSDLLMIGSNQIKMLNIVAHMQAKVWETYRPESKVQTKQTSSKLFVTANHRGLKCHADSSVSTFVDLVNDTK